MPKRRIWSKLVKLVAGPEAVVEAETLEPEPMTRAPRLGMRHITPIRNSEHSSIPHVLVADAKRFGRRLLGEYGFAIGAATAWCTAITAVAARHIDPATAGFQTQLALGYLASGAEDVLFYGIALPQILARNYREQKIKWKFDNQTHNIGFRDKVRSLRKAFGLAAVESTFRFLPAEGLDSASLRPLMIGTAIGVTHSVALGVLVANPIAAGLFVAVAAKTDDFNKWTWKKVDRWRLQHSPKHRARVLETSRAIERADMESPAIEGFIHDGQRRVRWEQIKEALDLAPLPGGAQDRSAKWVEPWEAVELWERRRDELVASNVALGKAFQAIRNRGRMSGHSFEARVADLTRTDALDSSSPLARAVRERDPLAGKDNPYWQALERLVEQHEDLLAKASQVLIADSGRGSASADIVAAIQHSPLQDSAWGEHCVDFARTEPSRLFNKPGIDFVGVEGALAPAMAEAAGLNMGRSIA